MVPRILAMDDEYYLDIQETWPGDRNSLNKFVCYLSNQLFWKFPQGQQTLPEFHSRTKNLEDMLSVCRANLSLGRRVNYCPLQSFQCVTQPVSVSPAISFPALNDFPLQWHWWIKGTKYSSFWLRESCQSMHATVSLNILSSIIRHWWVVSY